MSQSTPPPAPSGNGKYAIMGIAMLALAGLGYCMMNSSGGPTPPAVADFPDAAVPPRSTALVDETLLIPDEEPDAWLEIPDSGPAPRRPSANGGGGSWDCTGEVDRAALSRVLGESRSQFQSCYERRLKASPFLQGSVSVQMRIGANGSVDAVQVGGSLRDREVFACVRNVASRMQFARVTGGTCAVIAQPFTFTPQQ